MGGDDRFAEVVDFVEAAELAEAGDGGVDFVGDLLARGVGLECQFAESFVSVGVVAVVDGFEELVVPVGAAAIAGRPPRRIAAAEPGLRDGHEVSAASGQILTCSNRRLRRKWAAGGLKTGQPNVRRRGPKSGECVYCCTGWRLKWSTGFRANS